MPASELVAGDDVVVYPGEIIPVDGEIIDGHAIIDQKTITGEGLPVIRGKGEAAFAATVIRDGQMTVRALRVGSATTAGQIARLVESAPIGDTRMQNHAEQLRRPAGRADAGGSRPAPPRSPATSTASCRSSSSITAPASASPRRPPCLSSMTHAARAGIIIKSGGHMEKLADIDTVVFDKTGTLTHGTPAVHRRHHLSERTSPPDHLLGPGGGGRNASAASGRRGVAHQGA